MVWNSELNVFKKIKFVDKICYVVFRVNPHSIVAWMLRNALLESGMKSEV